MEEVRLRVTLAGKTLNGEYKIPDLGAFEFAVLQLRLICETIALACLVAHGDDPRAQTNKMKDAYRADWILKAVASINSGFYPEPGADFVQYDTGHLEFVTSPRPGLSKNELMDIYRRCDEHLHAGDFRSIAERYSATTDFAFVGDALPKIAHLLNFHRIQLIAPEEELWVWLVGPNGNVHAKLVAPVEYDFEGGPATPTDVSPRAGEA